MGCGGSSIEKQIPPEWFDTFAALKMTKSDMSSLLRVYRKIDKDGSGTVDLPELFVFLEIDHTPFTERVFNIFDMNGTGKVDFREFVLSLWNYCTLSKATLDIFTFDLYDSDASGVLSHEEVISMLTDIYGGKMKQNPHAHAVMQELHKVEAKGPFTVERFTKFAKTHQALLFPAFQLQLHLQEKIMGSSFWSRCSNRRVELSKGKFVTMGDLMELHVNQDLYNRFVRDASYYGRRTQSKAQLILQTTGTLQNRHHTEEMTAAAEANEHPSQNPGRGHRAAHADHHAEQDDVHSSPGRPKHHGGHDRRGSSSTEGSHHTVPHSKKHQHEVPSSRKHNDESERSVRSHQTAPHHSHH